ncbi:TRAM domain-containing protein [Halorubrum sp. ASP1]|jgi:predicted RNA-binding protein with TRAM domain|uniref:TRAM domain-containing protein n=1 Tax=Halorubrum sp. ASP1 TaxID=2518114 RepID=UPI0010F59F5E|nr:TRAM domain-containing protein [Halorubrum sp. ASP1]
MSSTSRKYESDEDEVAHQQAKAKDARSTFSIGETHEAVVTDSAAENNGRQAITNLNNIYIFIDDDDNTLSKGDYVKIRIFDVGENYAKAVCIAHLD